LRHFLEVNDKTPFIRNTKYKKGNFISLPLCLLYEHNEEFKLGMKIEQLVNNGYNIILYSRDDPQKYKSKIPPYVRFNIDLINLTYRDMKINKRDKIETFDDLVFNL
jgi:hypothetical protein